MGERQGRTKRKTEKERKRQKRRKARSQTDHSPLYLSSIRPLLPPAPALHLPNTTAPALASAAIQTAALANINPSATCALSDNAAACNPVRV